MTPATQSGRSWAGSLLALCTVAGLVVVAYPAWIIQPFRAQVASQLNSALTAVRIAPWTTAVALALGVIFAILLRPRGWRLAFAVPCVALLLFAAAMARIDYFEWMFHPDPAPRFVAAAQSVFADSDMVMVAHVGSDAHAYPVRMMAYHHLVNDTLGREPVVATY